MEADPCRFTRQEWLAKFPRDQQKYQAMCHANAVAAAVGEGKNVPRRVQSYYKNIHQHPQFRAAMEARGLDPNPIEVGCVATVRRASKLMSLNFYEAGLMILQGQIRLVPTDAAVCDPSGRDS